MKNAENSVVKPSSNDLSLNEILQEFNPTVEKHIKSVDDQVSEILMGRCPGNEPF